MLPKKISDSMTTEIIALAPDTSLLTTARLFALRHITGAPVVDRSGKPIGVVSQSDLVDPDRARTGRLGKPLYYRITDRMDTLSSDDALFPEGVVSDVMSAFVLSMPPDAPLLSAVKLMVAEDIHRLLVIEKEKLVGIITSMDILRAVLELARDVPPQAAAIG